jgi:energy-coupling factor transporter ATP-binding protein EcfA2
MPTALRVRDLWKSHSAGVRGCSARVWALRGCTLDISVGECVAIVGARRSGKSTLLECLAGRRRADAGRIEALPMPRLYLASCTATDVHLLANSPSAAHLLLLDDEGDSAAAARALVCQRLRGSTILLAARDVARVSALVDRVLLLRDGRLEPMSRTVVRRVAEPIYDDRGPLR